MSITPQKPTDDLPAPSLPILLDFLWNKRQPLDHDETGWIAQASGTAGDLVRRCGRMTASLSGMLAGHEVDGLDNPECGVRFSEAFLLISDLLSLTERVLQIAEEARTDAGKQPVGAFFSRL